MRMRTLSLLVISGVTLFSSYAFAKVQGEFLPWFLFYFLCSVFIYEVISYAVGVRYVSTERKLSATRLSAGQTLTIHVVGKRTGIWPLFWIRVNEDLPQRWLFQTQGADTVLQPLWKREFSLTYQIRGVQRGLYVIGDTHVETGDLLGLIRRGRTERRKTEVLVYPRVVPVAGWTGYQPEELGLRHPTRRRAEESSNVIGVRDYVPGDRLSRIHWPASARRGALQAKEFELHVASELLFIPDLSASSFRGNDPALFELEMTIVASLMKHVYDSHRPFGATLHGKQLVTFPTGCDEALFLRCMEALALAEADGSVDFAQSLIRIAQETPLGTTLVVVSPRLDRDIAVAAEIVRRKGPVEWFVPVSADAGELRDEQRQGLAMLQAARVNTYLIGSEDHLGALKRGGSQRVGSL
jgi:uncharacterized protein (DUF58 family)